MEPDVWMRKVDSSSSPHSAHVAAHVDDLLIASERPQDIVNLLSNKYKVKLKGAGPIKYHLGCAFARDENGTLCFAPRKCIEKMAGSCYIMFGHKPKLICMSPLEKGDHPELDTSEYLDEYGVQTCQSVVVSI